MNLRESMLTVVKISKMLQLARKLSLTLNKKYILVPATFDPNEECLFVISLFSMYKIQVEEVGKQTQVVEPKFFRY